MPLSDIYFHESLSAVCEEIAHANSNTSTDSSGTGHSRAKEGSLTWFRAILVSNLSGPCGPWRKE